MESRHNCCDQCPFMDYSTKGWLGPYSGPEQLHHIVMSEVEFACHRELDNEKLLLCAGSLMYMKKACKMPINSDLCTLVANAVPNKHTLSIPGFLNHHKPFKP